MRIESYKELIGALPINDHAETIKKSVWQNRFNGIFHILEPLFNGEEDFVIRRGDLFDLDKTSDDTIKVFIYKTLMWGYPGGGRGNMIYNIIAAVNRLTELSNRLNIEKLISIDGCGYSTLTKILYFYKKPIPDNQNNLFALIRDDKIKKSLKNWEEFTNLVDGNLSIIEKDTVDSYVKYVEIMNQIAAKYNFAPDQLEIFLYMFGSHLKN